MENVKMSLKLLNAVMDDLTPGDWVFSHYDREYSRIEEMFVHSVSLQSEEKSLEVTGTGLSLDSAFSVAILMAVRNELEKSGQVEH
jgi:hypothetical protein